MSTTLVQDPNDLPSDADVVVVGAGIMGLATAFHLAQLGAGRVVVVEKSNLCSGASGRNGGGIRAQWSSETNIELMKRSLELCADFATQMRVNVWFRRGGYLFLARNEERVRQLQKSADLQRDHGLPTRIIDTAEIRELVPEIDTSNVIAASWNPEDAVVFPWPFIFGYAKACQKLGVGVFPYTDVLELGTEGGRITSVVTDRGVVKAPLVVLATGAWSPELAAMVDVALPNRAHRHEICSTEPLKPFLGPLVADLESGLYFSQSMRGEIVGGVSNEHVPPGIDHESSARFLGLYARALTRTMPVLGGVRVLRQWAGCYDMTPDGNPIVGRVDQVEGLILLCGFQGHGFMMAPIMSKLLARYLMFGEEQTLFDRWSLRRYITGELLEETMILG